MSAPWFRRDSLDAKQPGVERLVLFTAHNQPGFAGPAEIPTPVRLSWFPADPLVVRAEFLDAEGRVRVEWLWPRALLVRGLGRFQDPRAEDVLTPWSVSDIGAWCGSGPGVVLVFAVRLSTPAGTARLTAPLGEVRDFLKATTEVCPVCSADLPGLGLLPALCKDAGCAECRTAAGWVADADSWDWAA